MDQLFRFPDSMNSSPAVEAWTGWQKGDLGHIAKRWFEIIRKCGDDVREVLHDGHPTACVADAAFAYVDAIALSNLIHAAYAEMKRRVLDEPKA